MLHHKCFMWYQSCMTSKYQEQRKRCDLNEYEKYWTYEIYLEILSTHDNLATTMLHKCCMPCLVAQCYRFEHLISSNTIQKNLLSFFFEICLLVFEQSAMSMTFFGGGQPFFDSFQNFQIIFSSRI